MQHVSKFLDQLVRLPGRLARLANRAEGRLLFLVEIGWVTSEQPNGILGREILQRNVGALRFLNDAHVLAQRKQEAMNLSFLSGVALRFDFSIQFSC